MSTATRLNGCSMHGGGCPGHASPFPPLTFLTCTTILTHVTVETRPEESPQNLLKSFLISEMCTKVGTMDQSDELPTESCRHNKLISHVSPFVSTGVAQQTTID